MDEPGRIHPYIQKQFDTQYQFNPADRPKSVSLLTLCNIRPISKITYTNEELKQKPSPEKYNMTGGV